MDGRRRMWGNAMGIAAMAGWSLSIAFTRRLGEANPFGLPGISYLVSGVLLVAFDRFRRDPAQPAAAAAPRRYWGGAGAAFVAYVVLYVAALSWSESRAVVLPLGLVNYFWPGLMLAMAPFFFPCRVRPAPLASGLAVCLFGVGLGFLWEVPLAAVAAGMRENAPAFAMMAAAAFLWGFYSNAVRKWGGHAKGTGWFLMASGAALLALWSLRGGPLGFTAAMTVPFLVHAVLVNAVSYRLWDLGMRWGDLTLLGTLANGLPLASMVVGGLYFGEGLTTGVWLGGAVVGLGALLCRRGVGES